MATSTVISTSATSTETSPPRKRKTFPKKPDPFLDLPLPTSPSPKSTTPPQTPPTSTATSTPQEEPTSLLYRTLVTPFLLTSFLLSLFLVNRRDLSRRAAAHPSSPSSRHARHYASYLSPAAWLSPEPYQNQRSGAWHVEPPAGGAGTGALERKGWFYRKKHRAMARLAIGDALDMRGRVLAGLVVAVVVGAVGSAWVVWRVYGRWMRA